MNHIIAVNPKEGWFVREGKNDFETKCYGVPTLLSFIRLINLVNGNSKYTFFETGNQKAWLFSGCVLVTNKPTKLITLTKKELYTLECLQKDGRIRHTLLTKQRLLDFNMIALVYPDRISNDSEYVYWAF